MKIFWKLFFLCLLPCCVLCQDFPEKPQPPKLVNDFTKTLSENERNALEQKLVAYNDTTSTQIAVVIMSSTGTYEISEYAFQLAEKWGVGQRGKNNGALILVAKDDRKVFIATGYGLEGAIPDARSKRIVETKIIPQFKQGNYYQGLDAATDDMIKLASGEYAADEKQGAKKTWAPFLLLMALFLIMLFVKGRKTKQYASLNGLNFWTAWMLMNAAAGRGSRSGRGFGSGRGSGGFGGGGFGGFGGGSFGGGGAGGRW